MKNSSEKTEFRRQEEEDRRKKTGGRIIMNQTKVHK